MMIYVKKGFNFNENEEEEENDDYYYSHYILNSFKYPYFLFFLIFSSFQSI